MTRYRWLLTAVLTLFPARALLAAPPPIAVFECPTASRWLTGASVTHLPVSADALESTTLPSGGVLVVPLDQVRSETQARRIAEYAARGGKLLAVYWGPLVRAEAQAGHPVYTLGPVVGVRPIGWRGADPITVRPGDRAGATEEIPDLRLPRGPIVRVEALPGATILARWAPAGRRAAFSPEAREAALGRPMGTDGASASAPEGTLAVGLGGHLYLAVDLFAPQNDTPEGRQLFLWAVNQLAPGAVFSQTRERAGAALAAVIRAETALAEAEKAKPDGAYGPLRDKLREARDFALRAKQAAATDRFFDATASSVRAHALAEEVLKALAPPSPPPPAEPEAMP